MQSLDAIYADIRNQQFSRSRLENEPSAILDHVLKEEYDDNWAPHTKAVREQDIWLCENVISSHAGYKIKVLEDDSKSMKARMCPHGNLDRERNRLHSDSKNAKFDIIPLLFLLPTLLGF